MTTSHLRLSAAVRRLAFPVFLALLTACSGALVPPPHPATVYIVRHAEKADGPDPALTDEGQARAKALADVILLPQHVYSTDTLRTRSTGAVLAKRHQLPVQIYDHRDAAALVARVRAHGGTTLIVGHSNTITDIAMRFGAEPGEPVREDEYDRLYVIRLSDPVESEIRRYGN